jgi:hypothetical protein
LNYSNPAGNDFSNLFQIERKTTMTTGQLAQRQITIRGVQTAIGATITTQPLLENLLKALNLSNVKLSARKAYPTNVQCTLFECWDGDEFTGLLILPTETKK